MTPAFSIWRLGCAVRTVRGALTSIRRGVRPFLLLLSSAAPLCAQEVGSIKHILADVKFSKNGAEWVPGKVNETLLQMDRVRAGQASRADILLTSPGLVAVKLNDHAEMTVGESCLSLRGEEARAWLAAAEPICVLTPNNVETYVTGTRINLELLPGNETVLTVVEGSAEFANPQGRVSVSAGQQSTAVLGVPPTSPITINPDNAVQWTLYYPTTVPVSTLPQQASAGVLGEGFQQLANGDPQAALASFESQLALPWGRIGAGMAHLALQDPASAIALFQGTEVARTPEEDAQLAAALLSSGEVEEARILLAGSLRRDPESLRSLLLFGAVLLIQNQKDSARAIAATALAAHPQSAAGHNFAGEVSQAFFELADAERHFDAALSLAPNSVRGLLNRARVRFGSDNIEGAAADVSRAAQLSPDEAPVLSLMGFVQLANNELAGARASFNAAVGNSSGFAEAYLGLGLVDIADGNLEGGLHSILTATLLDPGRSLYQSYLGKTFAELGSFDKALEAFSTANRLDDQDPTPWLYSSIVLRDLNRQIEALDALNKAIALNDGRAVYRSRLLLDRDLAVKNVSLAKTYQDLGFEARAAFEARRSIDTDPSNASAHLLMADAYGRLPDRGQASGSELLQFQVLSPVNQNSFHTFNEYTGLFVRRDSEVVGTIGTGSGSRRFLGLFTRGGNTRFGYASFLEFTGEQGARPEMDQQWHGFAQAKLALGRRTSAYAELSVLDRVRGEDEDIVELANAGYGEPFLFTKVRKDRDPDDRYTERYTHAGLGLSHRTAGGGAVTASLTVDRLGNEWNVRSDSIEIAAGQFIPVVRSTLSDLPFNVLTGQAQYSARVGGSTHVMLGARVYSIDKGDVTRDRFYDGPNGPLLFDTTTTGEAQDKGLSLWARGVFELHPSVHGTAGLQFQSDESRDLLVRERIERMELLPSLGVSWEATPEVVLRVGLFRALNAFFFGRRLGPTEVSGFIEERNEHPMTRRDEVNVSLERVGDNSYQSVHGFRRRSELPLPERFLAPGDQTQHGALYNLNLTVGKGWTVFATSHLMRTSTRLFDRVDSQTSVGVNFVHRSGIRIQVSDTYSIQRFSNTTAPELTNNDRNLVDLQASYELPRKRGRVALKVLNLLGQDFVTVADGLAVLNLPSPRRSVEITLKVVR